MVHLVQFTDPNSKEMEKALRAIPKCPGTCIFVDIVSSTEVKYTCDIALWGRRLNNTFNFISLLNDFPENIVKGIGDEMMLFIPDTVLAKKHAINDYYSLLEEVYATILNLQRFPLQDMFYHCKLSIHYCTEVYNVTFLKGFNDYYGRDIDLSARLMGKTRAGRLVFSETFYRKVLGDLRNKGISRDKTCLNQVSVKMTEEFKGIPKPVSYRFIDV
jgi:class 3 adenylate cyclase